MNTKKLCIALAAASLAAVLGLARAQDPAGGKQTVPSQVVRLSDLDLSNPGDVRLLYGRIQTAAWRVCLAMVPRPASIQEVQCRHVLVNDTVARINHPALTALHHGKSSVKLTAGR